MIVEGFRVGTEKAFKITCVGVLRVAMTGAVCSAIASSSPLLTVLVRVLRTQ